MTQPYPIFVRPKRFGELIGSSERTVWRDIADGVIPTIKIGRRRLIKVAEGVAALERRAREQAAESVPRPAA